MAAPIFSLAEGGVRSGMYLSGSQCPETKLPVRRLADTHEKYPRVGALAIASAVCALTALVISTSTVRAGGTSYDYQVGGFIAATLYTLIEGEFVGRKISNDYPTPPQRPVCKPADYLHLRDIANDSSKLSEFNKRCKLIEVRMDGTLAHGIAYLPKGYCEGLKTAFEDILEREVFSVPYEGNDTITYEYKGARYSATRRRLARSARLQAVCQDDGALRISAPRKRQ
jgi:hypothetical protein